jgi:voltage-gated potassium channel
VRGVVERRAAVDPDVHLPSVPVRPLRAVALRLVIAVTVLVLTVVLVYVDRDGYRDSTGGPLTFIDCVYYATVTLSTTGYGDIVPASEGARLVNALVITPLRVIFLIVLVGTTLEVLAATTRTEWRQRRWRRQMKDHTVIVGFGTKGRSAALTLLNHGTAPEDIVVIDDQRTALARANELGLVSIWGEGTRTRVLEKAEAAKAKTVIIATQRDDTAVLCTLTARKLNPRAFVAVSVREAENAPLVRQSGADSVVTSSEAAGQMLGVSALSPQVGQVVTDLLSYGEGLDIVEAPAGPGEIGEPPGASRLPVLAVIRDGELLRFDDPRIGGVRAEDRVVVVRPSEPNASGHIPGTHR